MSKSSKSSLDSRKVSGELFTLTYGALVAQLIKDYEEDDRVNGQLDKMGYNIGLRLIDDFLAKNPSVGRCSDFREVADVLAKHGFRTYLGVTPSVTNWSSAQDEFSLIMDNNPLMEFVEFPTIAPPVSAGDASGGGSGALHRNLHYSQMICGAIRGALEMIHIEVQVWIVVPDSNKSAAGSSGESTEIRIRFIRKVEETVPAGED